MTHWKVYDAEDAVRLRARLGSNAEIETSGESYFSSLHDAVLLAPAAQSGEAIVIRVRNIAKPAPAPVPEYVAPAVLPALVPEPQAEIVPEPLPVAAVPEPPPVVAAPVAETPSPEPAAQGPRYVATGFLGLSDELDDEPELEQPAKPWWRRLF